ncbi:MAG: MoaD/ThiS family protein [Dehalococcoidia bacterium]
MNDDQKAPETPGTTDEARARMRSAISKLMSMKREIEVAEDKTVDELMTELQLSSAPVLLEIGGEVFRPDEIGDKKLRKGDKVAVVPLIAGG